MAVQISGNDITVPRDTTVTRNLTVGGVLTYEDVTNVDSIGIVTARAGVLVGSGITLSKDGDIFATGVTTATTFVGALTGNVTGDVTGTASQVTIASGADNRVLTAASANTIQGESNVNINGGILIAGHTASTTVSDGEGPFIQVKSTDSRGGVSLIRHSADAAGGGLYIGKSRNATIGSNTIVQNDDELGRITFSGDDGNDIHTQAAAIKAYVDGTPGANDMPGDLRFYTNVGDTGVTERLRILSSGRVSIGNATNNAAASVVFGVTADDGEAADLYVGQFKNLEATSGQSYGLNVQAGSSSVDHGFRVMNRANDSTQLLVRGDGKIGISTQTPNARLHVLSGNEAGILIEDNDNGNNAPYLEIIGKRTDGNTHQSFSGQVFLSRNRTEQKISSGLKLGTVLFGGNHTDASKSNILYPASIAGMSSGDFNSASDMPTDLVFFTGYTGRAPTVANVSSGTERMRINRDGIITMNNKPSFFATLDTGGNNTTTVNNPIAFNITRHNNGSHYDTSNYYFVAPAAGYYFFHSQVWAKNSTGNASIHFYFEDASNSYSGGAVNRSGFHANGLNMQDRSIYQTIVYFMDTGDRMSVRADNQDITYWTAGNSNPHTFFCGYMIG